MISKSNELNGRLIDQIDTTKVIPIPLPSGGIVILELPYPIGLEDYQWLVDTVLPGLQFAMSAPNRHPSEAKS